MSFTANFRWGVLISILVLVSAPNVFALEEVAIQFEKANQAYRSDDFAKASSGYEKILQQGYRSPELYYNLGNAYYKLEKFPQAILQYERALRMSPGDEDVIHNLTYAKLRLQDRIEPIPELFVIRWWKVFVHLRSADQWAWLGLIALWSFLLAIGALLTLRRPVLLRRLCSLVVLTGICVLLLSLAGMLGQFRIEKSRNTAILLSPSVHVRSAPEARSTDLFVIHEGVKLQLLDSVSGWSKIRLADGKIGWIPADTFEVI